LAGDYQKVTFKNGEAPAINATNLNHMQTQYDKAKELVDTHEAEDVTQGKTPHGIDITTFQPAKLALGDVLFHSNDPATGKLPTVEELQKVKEIQIGIDGDFRVKFDLYVTKDNTGEAQIYKNGVPIGTLRTLGPADSTMTVTYTEDILNIKAGDYLQLYGRHVTGISPVKISNFRLYVDKFEGCINTLGGI
jgi:hypothetical protein